MKKKVRTTKKSALYVAVVCAENSGMLRSGRPEGDWAAFINTDRACAISAALRARSKWTASGRFGPYRVLVGTLSENVLTPTNYKLVKL